MKKIITLILFTVLALSFNVSASANEVNHYKISLGSTVDELIELYPNVKPAAEKPREVGYNLYYDTSANILFNQEVLANLYFFKNNRLFKIATYFKKDSKSAFDDITNQVNSLYGTPEKNIIEDDFYLNVWPIKDTKKELACVYSLDENGTYILSFIALDKNI